GVPEIFSNSGTSTEQTGNDTRYYPSVGFWIRVNVYGGSIPGISWTDGTNTGNDFLVYDARDPDVAIVDCGGTYFACVAYHSVSYGGWMLDYWKWTGTGFSLSATLPIEAGNYGTAINIDANANNSFAVIWDNPDDGIIKMIAGNGDPSGGYPIWCTPVPCKIPDTDKKIFPDVSLHEGQAGDPSGTYVHYCYTSPNGDELTSRFDKLWYICNYVPNTLYDFDIFMPPATWAGYPRIACPNNNGIPSDYSVVYNFVDPGNTLYEIKGVTGYNGNTYFHDYTDGSEGTCPLLGEYHKYPAVSYDNKDNGIIVGWNTCWNMNLTEFIPCNVVAVQCNPKGYVTNNIYYKTVPFKNLPNPRETAATSLSGRDGKYMLVTFMDWTNTDVDYKDFLWNDATFRLSADADGIRNNISVYPNPSSVNPTVSFTLTNDIYTAEVIITDISGKSIDAFNLLNVSGNQLSLSTLNLNSGIYFARLVINGQTEQNTRFVILE
ncbi:MAG: T9SS type A sorting domain-containing protein, partial [Bacteroidota bacterium]